MSSVNQSAAGKANLSVCGAAYWIAFGPHGPRALPPPGEGKKVAAYTAAGVLFSFIIFVTVRSFANPAPRTMTKEWQEATNEYLKERKPYLPNLSSSG